MSLENSLENYLKENIPLSVAMGIEVEHASSQRIVLRAPFSNNINHKKTVFGGSLHAVATLACWSLLHVNLVLLEGQKVQLVIARSEVDYLSPVTTDFKAECTMPGAAEWIRFTTTFQKRGKARLKLSSRIPQEGRLCVDYTGVFVALLINENMPL